MTAAIRSTVRFPHDGGKFVDELRGQGRSQNGLAPQSFIAPDKQQSKTGGLPVTVKGVARNRAPDFSTRFGDNPHHTPQPHELRNAWLTAKQLEDRLELADQPVLRRIARYVRESLLLELMALEGYVEVPRDGS